MGCPINTYIVVLVFILILVIAIVATIIIDPRSYSVSRWYVFIGTFASMSLILTVMFYYFLINNQKDQQKLIIIKETKHIGSTILDVNIEEMRRCSSIIPSFTASLLPLSFNNNRIIPERGNDIDEYQAEIHKISLSYKIFHSWETALISKDFLGEKKLSYIISFLQWANSEQLREKWEEMKVTFMYNTQDFGDLLFDYASKIENKTALDYEIIAKKLLIHCRKLFN